VAARGRHRARIAVAKHCGHGGRLYNRHIAQSIEKGTITTQGDLKILGRHIVAPSIVHSSPAIGSSFSLTALKRRRTIPMSSSVSLGPFSSYRRTPVPGRSAKSTRGRCSEGERIVVRHHAHRTPRLDPLDHLRQAARDARARRIKSACSMLAAGKQRVCCFDRSGFLQ
jgi:hypothetical protein